MDTKNDFEINLPVVLRGIHWVGGADFTEEDEAKKNDALGDIATALYALVYAVEVAGGQDVINQYKDGTGTGCFDYAFRCIQNLKDIGEHVEPIADS